MRDFYARSWMYAPWGPRQVAYMHTRSCVNNMYAYPMILHRPIQYERTHQRGLSFRFSFSVLAIPWNECFRSAGLALRLTVVCKPDTDAIF